MPLFSIATLTWVQTIPPVHYAQHILPVPYFKCSAITSVINFLYFVLVSISPEGRIATSPAMAIVIVAFLAKALLIRLLHCQNHPLPPPSFPLSLLVAYKLIWTMVLNVILALDVILHPIADTICHELDHNDPGHTPCLTWWKNSQKDKRVVEVTKEEDTYVEGVRCNVYQKKEENTSKKQLEEEDAVAERLRSKGRRPQ